MDSDTSGKGPTAVEGVEFLPARERWDQTSVAVASFLVRYRDLTFRPTAKKCSRSCGGAPNVSSSPLKHSGRTWSCSCAGWKGAGWR